MTPPTTPTQAEREYVAGVFLAYVAPESARIIRSGQRDDLVLAIMRFLRTNPLPEQTDDQ